MENFKKETLGRAVTVVTGFWSISSKFDDESYKKWFGNTLRINCPYVVFGRPEILELVKEIRWDLPTFCIEMDVNEFYCWKFRDFLATHPRHVPSVELNMIWNEKVFLVQQAAALNPFNTDWFAWADAGLAPYRESAPPEMEWPDTNVLKFLPEDKLIVSSSTEVFLPKYLEEKYYHHIAGTAFLVNINFIQTFAEAYKKAVDKFLSFPGQWKYTDQVIHTFIYNDQPELYCLIDHGYGAIITALYKGELNKPKHNNVGSGKRKPLVRRLFKKFRSMFRSI